MLHPVPLFDAMRISRSAGDLRPPLIEATGTALHKAGAVASDFVGANDVLAAAFADGTLRGFDAIDLTELWAVELPRGPIPSRFNGAPVVVDGTLVLQSNGRWRRHALVTGELIDAFDAPPLSLRRGLALGSDILGCWWQDDSAHMGRLDLSAGALRWSHPVEGSANGIMALCDGVAALALSNTYLGGFDAATGAEIWRCDISGIGVVEGPFAAPTGLIAGWPVCVSGVFLLPVQVGHWVGVDPATGAIRWQCRLEASAAGTAALHSGHFICLSEGSATAIDPSDGNLIWSTAFHDPGLGHFGAPVVSGGYLWAVGARDGRLIALDAAGGIPAWHGPFGDLTPPDRPPVILAKSLISADDGGTIRVFRQGT